MCTYNGSEFLKKQLDSITSQTRTLNELIVCDDCSSDGTIQILNDYVETAKFPVTIRCNVNRLGAPKNFEQGIALTQGDVIVLSDQDDVWRDDKLQILEQVLSQNPNAGYAFSDAIIIDEDGKTVSPSLWQRVSFNSKRRALFSRSPMDQLRVLVGKSVVTGATMAFRSSLKPIVLPIRELWIHDEWIAFASSLQGNWGVPVQAPLIYYRQHTAQAIGVPQQGFWGLLKRGRKYFSGDVQAYDYYERELRKWNILYALLKGSASQGLPVLPLVEAKVAHVTLRAKLYRKSRAIRLAAIMGELIRGRYHFYSAGYKSAIKDLLVPMASDLRLA